MLQTRLTPEEIVGRGKEIYERDLRARLETDGNIGLFLVIDIGTGEYEMDRDHYTAVRRLRDRQPGGRRYSMRIGYAAAYSIGPNRPLSEAAS